LLRRVGWQDGGARTVGGGDGIAWAPNGWAAPPTRTRRAAAIAPSMQTAGHLP